MGLGSFFSSVGSFISSVGSSICNAVSSIGSAVSSFVSGVGSIVAGVIGAIPAIAQSIGKIATGLMQSLGIIKPKENVEELGERAMQAASKGITPERFEKFDEYMKELRDFDLDAAISQKRKPEEKIVAGLAVGTHAIEQKYNAAPGSLSGMWLLPMANPDYFNAGRIENLLTAGRLGGDVFGYLEKKLSDGAAIGFEKSLAVNADGSSMDVTQQKELQQELDKALIGWENIVKTAQDRQAN